MCAFVPDAPSHVRSVQAPGCRVASAIEFILEGLHLSNKLNKTVGDSGTTYGTK